MSPQIRTEPGRSASGISATTRPLRVVGGDAGGTPSSVPASDDYTEFCSFLKSLCGVDLGQYKRQQMERRLRSFFEQRGITDLRESFGGLRSDAALLDQLLDRITINVSQLWRNPEQWDLLAAKVLPELAGRGSIDAWSAGCSYGAEAYTLAAECALTVPSVRVRIRGTDIDRRMVARAQLGHFSADDARTAPPDKLSAGFDEVIGGWRANSALRAMTTFERGDLLTLAPRRDSFDLVLCRNTVIYFTEDVRDELHARLATALRPGGYLIVGSTERVADAAALNLSPAHPFIYRKS
jgi:chemotaxis protein methyltransferase CheR